MLWWLAGLAGLSLIGWGVLSTYRTLHPLPQFLMASPVTPAPRTVTFIADDRQKFEGWVLEAPAARGVVITCHGYKANRLQLVPIAEGLCRRGYTMMLFDLRGHGSRRGRCTFGTRDVKDLGVIMQWCRANPALAALPVGLLGLSMGGAVACQAAAQFPDIKAVVVDSAYARLFPVLAQSIRKTYHLPSVFARVTWAGLALALGRGLSHADPVVVAARARQPLLIIHGMEDQSVSPEQARQLYAAWQGPKEQWLHSQGGHIGIGFQHPDEYANRVAEFFHRWLQPAVLSSRS